MEDHKDLNDTFSPNELRIIAQALERYIREGTFVLSFTGYIRKEDEHGLSEAAEMLLRLEGIETVLVIAVESTDLVGRFRTSSGAIDALSWVNGLFPSTDPTEREADAVTSFSDKNNVDFTIPLGLMGRTTDKAALMTLIETLVKNLFLDKVGK